MNISVFGLGYVGTVSLACLAKLGHHMIGVDVQEEKVRAIGSGTCPLIEPELEGLLGEGMRAGRVAVTLDPAEAVGKSDVSLVCVGTPSGPGGEIDLSYVRGVCRQIGQGLARRTGRHVVVIRSTVMPGSLQRVVVPVLEEASGRKCGKDFGACTNPEFLREGSAVKDFFHPPMVLIGESSLADGDLLAGMYAGLNCPVHRCSPDEAMMVKYACNAFHATKVVFGNEMGALCNRLGLNSRRVMDLFCQDQQLNISPRYLRPGFAFGGSCLPKDVRALMALGRDSHLKVPLLDSLLESNRSLVDRAVELILRLKPQRVGILGLSFKDQTDDLRESPIVEVAERLLGKGIRLRVHDADVRASHLFGRNLSEVERHLPHLASLLCEDLDLVLAEADVVVLAKPSALYQVAPKKTRADQKIVDLVGLLSPSEAPPERYFSVTL